MSTKISNNNLTRLADGCRVQAAPVGGSGRRVPHCSHSPKTLPRLHCIGDSLLHARCAMVGHPCTGVLLYWGPVSSSCALKVVHFDEQHPAAEIT